MGMIFAKKNGKNILKSGKNLREHQTGFLMVSLRTQSVNNCLNYLVKA